MANLPFPDLNELLKFDQFLNTQWVQITNIESYKLEAWITFVEHSDWLESLEQPIIMQQMSKAWFMLEICFIG